MLLISFNIFYCTVFSLSRNPTRKGNHSILNRCECGGTFPEQNRQLDKAEDCHFQESAQFHENSG